MRKIVVVVWVVWRVLSTLPSGKPHLDMRVFPTLDKADYFRNCLSSDEGWEEPYECEYEEDA